MAAIPQAPQPPLAVVAGLVHGVANAVEALPLPAGNGITIEAINNLILASEARMIQGMQDLELRMAASEARMIQGMQDLELRMAASEARMIQAMQDQELRLNNTINAQAVLLPLRLCNSRNSNTSALQYPAGVVGAEAIAPTKQALHHLTVPDCTRLADLLGLDLPPNMTVVQKRERIIEYLGAF